MPDGQVLPELDKSLENILPSRRGIPSVGPHYFWQLFIRQDL